MSNLENISSLTSNSLSNNAKDRLSKVTSSTKTTILSRFDIITKNISDLTRREKDIIEEYNIKFKELNNNSKLSTQTQEEKQKNYDDLQKKKDEELLFIKNEIEQLKKDLLDDEINPLKDAKANLNKFKITNNRRIKKSKEERSKANKDRIKSILTNTTKTLASIISSLLTNQIVNITSNDAKLQELVDRTNEVIDAANTQEKLNQARVLRNSALNILNTQEKKVKLIQNIVKTLTTIVRIISILIRVLSLIPLPPFTPPKVTVLLIRFTKLLDALNVILSTINPILQRIIDNLERLKSELKQIGDLLENPSLNGLNGDLLKSTILSLRNPINNGLGGRFEEYKGFKFELRTEENLGAHRAVVVNNIKRKFAVAINRDGVVVVQSDYSFTQDPNDLIDQIKLIIDQRNLQG